MFPNSRLRTLEEDDRYLRKRNAGAGNALVSASGMIGGAISAGANGPQGAAIGGALSGASMGASFGPIGALFGAGVGALTGAVRGGNLATAQATSEEARRNSIYDDYAVPTQYGKGGFPLESVQTEKGEWASLPNGILAKVAASKTHEEMGSKEVTDNLEEGSYVFSDRPQQSFFAKGLSLPEDFITDYKEAYPGETISNPDYMSVFGDKELTPAEAVSKVSSFFKVKASDPSDLYYSDPIARATDVDNIKSRAPYVSAIAAHQEKRKGEIAIAEPVEVQDDVQKLSGLFGSSVVGGRESFSDFYNMEKEAIDRQREDANRRYAEDEDVYGRLGDRMRGRSAASAALNAFASAASPVTVEPTVLRPQNMSAYRESSPFEREAAVRRSQSGARAALSSALANQRYDQVGALIQAVESSGLPVEREFDRRDERSRINKQRELSRVSDANERSRVQAENASRQNSAKALTGMTSAFSEGLRDFNTIDVSETGAVRQAANNRDFSFDQADRQERSLESGAMRYGLSQERLQDRRDKASSLLKNQNDLLSSGPFLPGEDIYGATNPIPSSEIDKDLFRLNSTKSWISGLRAPTL